ncbi:vesicle-associated membrane protein 5 isoform X1 [Silurus meridionalis]|uniref:V-SNARE coiled-coil homology domain-containing protein n=2 Tax=Silurus meridionalis TaxID=175797 RepID=A0A8T0A9R7_SILME|nr:vesicle-associated membrane protein 5 isoform X1 [Silurus meridionalis]KAF7687666.1 hypothetical protein HF521_014894 [Silurus meridionalis]
MENKETHIWIRTVGEFEADRISDVQKKTSLSDTDTETRTETVMENGKSQLQQAQDDVEEVRGIMLDNLNKASEREGKLGDLENRADNLLEQSKVFSKTANQVKQKKRWENNRLKVIIGVICAVVLISVIIIVTTVSLRSS